MEYLGLQCCSAPYAWKLAFQSDEQLYELILCACSRKEEKQWKAKLLDHSVLECRRQIDEHEITPPLYSILDLQMKSLGHAFGLPGTLSRRLSIQRAATVNPRSGTQHVVIRNTNALSGAADSHDEPQDVVGRSQSLMSTNRIPILTPRRSDRTRLEHMMSKVWTRENLPYPGMASNRGEQLIRASANSVIRKLSKTSVSGNFSKRSASVSSINEAESDRDYEVSSINGTGRKELDRSRSLERLRGIDNQTNCSPRRFGLLGRPSFTGSTRRLTRYHSCMGHSLDHSNTSKDGLLDMSVKCMTAERSRGPSKAVSIDGLRTWFEKS